jgi:DNA-binding transcriptional regulator YiaG
VRGLGTRTPEDLIASAQARRDLPPPVMRRAIRKATGTSLRAVAEAVGVTPQAVAFWEEDERTPTGERLVKYVQLLRSLERSGG